AMEPRERRVAILERGGEGVLRAQPVIDGGHDDAQTAAERDVPGLVVLGMPHDEAPAMYPQQRRPWSLRRERAIHANPQPVAVRSRDMSVTDGDVGQRRRTRRAAPAAELAQQARGRRAERELRYQERGAAQLRVKPGCRPAASRDRSAFDQHALLPEVAWMPS